MNFYWLFSLKKLTLLTSVSSTYSTQKTMHRKEEIQTIASEMFGKKGYKATSMRDLASEVGIKAASLYSHYQAGKASILKEICFNVMKDFEIAQEKIEARGGNPEQKLRNAIQFHVQIIIKHQNAISVFLNDWIHLNEPHLSAFKKAQNKYEQFLIDILLAGKDIGFFMVGNEYFTIKTILASINWIHLWYDPKGKYSPLQIADRLILLIFNGLKFKY